VEFKQGKNEFPYGNLSSNIRLYRQEERLLPYTAKKRVRGGKGGECVLTACHTANDCESPDHQDPHDLHLSILIHFVQRRK